MRNPPQPRRLLRASRRTRIVLIVVGVAIVVGIASLRAAAGFWTDYLWFSSVNLTSVFKGVLLTKVVLSLVFIAIFFTMLMISLWVADRTAPFEVDPAETNELVLRYREFVFGRARRIRIAVSAVFALLGGVGADRQWNNWDLFEYHVNFGVKDAQFHRDVGFYVFRLPFIQFLISWAFEATIVVFMVTAVVDYLSGGISPQASGERVRPAVKAHLSVLLGLLAVIKAVGYYYDRLALVLSRSHVVDGATNTSVHADSPAKILLMLIAVISALLFLANIRQRGWILPAVGVALWGLVSVLVGAAYPAAYQALRVNPSALTREAPYIQRNIDATLHAYGLDKVNTVSNYNYSPTLDQSEIQGSTPQAQVNRQTISNVRLLDPAVDLVNSFDKYQGLRSYYSFNSLFLDRYPMDLNGSGRPQETATVASVRELNSDIPSGFVNQRLEYTHGYGAVLAPTSQSGVEADGTPAFVLSGIPATSSQQSVGLDEKGSEIYYGLGADTNGYVIARSKTAELEYGLPGGGEKYNSYAGDGGVPAGSLLRRAAFALRFGDANFVLSGQVSPSSRVMYVRNVLDRVRKAAPFLKFDSDPYAVVLNNQVVWVIDAYTTSDNYPYSQDAVLDGLPADSGLQTGFNYVRNSVKVVVSAYDGSMHFYDMGTRDPILSVYEKAFPGLFHPVSQASHDFPGITAHFRYPENLFQVQTNMYGRYHLTSATDFYTQAQAWSVSPDPGSGKLTTSSAIGSTVTGAAGQLAPSVPRLQPQYIEAALPNSTDRRVNFLLITPFVPVSATGTSQNLTAFMTANSDPGPSYGQLTLYKLPAGTTVDGPGLISNAIKSNSAISSELTLLDQRGSQVELGEVDVIPIDQTLLYVQPVYVESVSNQIPSLDDVVVVYNGTAYHSQNASLDAALCQITNNDGSRPFSSYCSTAAAQRGQLVGNTGGNTPPSGGGGSGPTTTTTTTAPGPAPPGATGTPAQLLAAANADFAAANDALKAGDLGLYQRKVSAGQALVAQALKELNASAGASSTTTTTAHP